MVDKEEFVFITKSAMQVKIFLRERGTRMDYQPQHSERTHLKSINKKLDQGKDNRLLNPLRTQHGAGLR